MALTAPRHFLALSDIPAEALASIVVDSIRMKHGDPPGSGLAEPLAGKVLAMIFDSPSTRTRVSFDVAMRQLGGTTIVISGNEMQLGRGETVADTARVLSRYVDAIMIRKLDHEFVAELARHASVPVINGLTRKSHPCQVMADIVTFEERKGSIAGKRIAWSGDANNVLNSWIEAAQRFRFQLAIATPPEWRPAPTLVDWARSGGADVVLTKTPEDAARGADCVVTDTWVSMGDKDAETRHRILTPYRVTAKVMAAAKPDAIFMHCLPAHRGEEVEAVVIDGPQSVVFDEAENRLHAQKGILAWCFGGRVSI